MNDLPTWVVLAPGPVPELPQFAAALADQRDVILVSPFPSGTVRPAVLERLLGVRRAEQLRLRRAISGGHSDRLNLVSSFPIDALDFIQAFLRNVGIHSFDTLLFKLKSNRISSLTIRKCARLRLPLVFVVHSTLSTPETLRRLERYGKVIVSYGTAHPTWERQQQERECAEYPSAFRTGLRPASTRDQFVRTTTIIVGSAGARRSFLLEGYRPDQVASIAYGLDTSIWTPAAPRARPALADRTSVVTFGRMTAGKGIPVLLTAVKQAESLKVTLIGYLDPALSVEPDANVTLIGITPRATLATLLPQFDVGVFLSASEGFGYAPLEALAAGLPVVVTPAYQIAELASPAIRVVPTHPTAEQVVSAITHLRTQMHVEDLRTAALGAAHQYDWSIRRIRVREALLELEHG